MKKLVLVLLFGLAACNESGPQSPAEAAKHCDSLKATALKSTGYDIQTFTKTMILTGAEESPSSLEDIAACLDSQLIIQCNEGCYVQEK
jgi:hypothetical protein